MESKGMDILTLSYSANSCTQDSPRVFLNMHLQELSSTLIVLLFFIPPQSYSEYQWIEHHAELELG